MNHVSNITSNHERLTYTVTQDMLTRETLDQRENPSADETHKMMY